MNDHPGTLHTVRWNQICPWLLLVRAVRPALFVRVLVLAWCGVWLTHSGWFAIESQFAAQYPQLGIAPLTRLSVAELKTESRAETLNESSWDFYANKSMPRVSAVDLEAEFDSSEYDKSPWDRYANDLRQASPLVHGWAWAIQPLARLVSVKTWQEAAAQTLAGIWTIAVWALIGGAIARIAAVWLTRREALGILASVRGAVRDWPTFAGAPSLAFLGLLVMSLPFVLAGLLARLGIGELLVATLWGVTLLGGIAFFIAALGLLLGWPLMWATAAVERTDAFDGISRAYAYAFQRPLHMLFYLAVSSLLGLLAQFLLVTLVQGGVESAIRLVDFGAGRALRPSEHWQAASYWQQGLLNLVAAFPMAYLWTTAVGIYLLLRQQIDSTELDQIKLDTTLQPGLPPLGVDPATGVPTLKETGKTKP